MLGLGLGLAGCGWPRGAAPAPGVDPGQGSVAPVGSSRTAVIEISGQEGGLATPGGFSTQAVVHRWIPADVDKYQVLLDQRGADGPGGVPTWLPMSTVAVRPQLGETRAMFGNLASNQAYRVSVQAFTASAVAINLQNPVVLAFDFIGVNDVDDTRTLSTAVLLDDVPFVGKAGISLSTLEGAYVTTGPITATAY